MTITAHETKRAATRRTPTVSPCVITSTPPKFGEERGYLAKICSSSEDKFVSGVNRKDAVQKAVAYAREVLGIPGHLIRFGDGVGAA